MTTTSRPCVKCKRPFTPPEGHPDRFLCDDCRPKAQQESQNRVSRRLSDDLRARRFA